MRLIDAVALVRDIDIAFKGIKASYEEFERFRDLCGLIWMQPIVDPVKHGRWVEHGKDDNRCSLCGWGVWVNTNNYCPNCGAKMEV